MEGRILCPPPPRAETFERTKDFLRAPYRRLALMFAGVSALAAGAIYAFSPAESAFFPACPIHLATGFYCPGCGATRALHALFHGNIADAMDYNTLFVILLPAFAAIGVLQFISMFRDNQIRALAIPQWIQIAVAISMLLFAIARNLPYGWSQFLAP